MLKGPRDHQGPYPKPMCLTMERWDEINDFVRKTGVKLAFGLNGMYGRPSRNESMNTTNLYEFLKYTVSKQYPIFALELGNELGNGGEKGWRVLPKVYSQDIGIVRSYIDQVCPKMLCHLPIELLLNISCGIPHPNLCLLLLTGCFFF